MFDEYELKARIAPGLLVAVPIGLAGLIYFGIDFGLEAGFIAVGVMLGGGVLLAKVVSDHGGSTEQLLFESWGGMPSVQLLRHRDQHISEHAKTRIHAELAAKAKLAMTTIAEESMDSASADRVYRQASDWLRANTRDKQRFPTVFARNCEYGFARNAYGVRRLALGVSAATTILVLVTDVVLSQVVPGSDRVVGLSQSAIGVVACVVVWSLVWITYFTTERVRVAAFSYARALLEQVDAVHEA